MMRTHHALLRALLLASPALVPAVFEKDAHAENGFALNRFEPAERGSSWFVLDSIAVKGSGKPAAGLALDYQNRPLAIRSDGDTRTPIVGHVLTTHVGASVAFWDRMRFGMNLPVVFYTQGEAGSVQSVTYNGPTNEQAVGDLRLGTDARLFGETTGRLTMALGARLWAPTGSTANYTGDGGVRAGPRVSAAGQFGLLVYGASLGVTFRDPAAGSFAGTPVDHDMPFALSAGARLANGTIMVGPELYGTTVLTDAAFKTRTTPLEMLVGGHYAMGGGFRAGAGIGTGLVSGFGAPQVRLLGSIEWAGQVERDRDGDGIPDALDACANTKGSLSADPARNGCPAEAEIDTDGDGVLDAEDACADVYGRPTSDKRTNGCADRDFDGVMDPVDACPKTAGPASDDPKTSGCPPKPGDKDDDGILDDADACPDAAGAKDEDPELNGCPDPDRDHDGIGNDQDACPDIPGTAAPDNTKNGCPSAFLRRDEILLKEQVQFKPASEELAGDQAVLQAILEIMKAHPEIVKLRVEAHTDNRGAPGANKRLSTLRATSIVNWLASHGIEPSRLVGNGFGEERPLDSNDAEAGRETNRRVELHIERAEAAAP